MLWLEAMGSGRVWLRAARIGLPVGLLQAVINQGDHWMAHAVDGAVLAKSIASPLVTFAVALLSAAAMQVEKTKDKNAKHEL